ncbi:peroxide stress protein YaaA [Chloropicon primus]|uniref:Peroxide stress protein YaaA n=1 Tax=Chloropicon primus TaxID=1764295 RepID=A0A5B8MRZ4_9CHLO|nr:peroxide stress protein YaaA [Chloropicon primus]|eukprot:QDZ23223.1 peroxide stress protein YaaA [Chloropicon primus]
MKVARKGAESKARRVMFLLSPAKAMDLERTHKDNLPASLPMLQIKQEQLLNLMKTKTKSELKTMMKLSDKLADLNYQRYRDFENLERRPAAICFDGQAYQGLRAYELPKERLLWLHDNLRVLSGLYGVIRPLDEIKPYRLEMGTKVATDNGRDLYQFWGDDITDTILEDLAEGDALVNVASQEYAKAVNFSKCRSAGIDLYEMKFPGPAVFAKKARGSIVRFACENGMKDPQELRSWCGDGEYSFVDESFNDKTHFTVFTFNRDKAAAAALASKKKKQRV